MPFISSTIYTSTGISLAHASSAFPAPHLDKLRSSGFLARRRPSPLGPLHPGLGGAAALKLSSVGGNANGAGGAARSLRPWTRRRAETRAVPPLFAGDGDGSSHTQQVHDADDDTRILIKKATASSRATYTERVVRVTSRRAARGIMRRLPKPREYLAAHGYDTVLVFMLLGADISWLTLEVRVGARWVFFHPLIASLIYGT